MFSRAPILRRAAITAQPFLNRSFHATARGMIKVGDAIPAAGGLFEKSAANKANLAQEFSTGNGYIIGVPGAFTGTCSSTHIPSWINHPNIRKSGHVFVVSVNDPFV